MKISPNPVHYLCAGAVGAALLINIGVHLASLHSQSLLTKPTYLQQPTIPVLTPVAAVPANDSPVATTQDHPTSAQPQQSENQDVQDKPLPPAEEQRLFERKAKVNYKEIWMGRTEVNLLLRYLDGRKTYIEYGSGGSTFNFPQFVEHAVSVEHDRAWCAKVREKLKTRPELKHIDYRCWYVEKGHRGFIVEGNTDGNYVHFKEYVDQIDTAGHQLYDFVLIDGRARVDCSVKVLSYISQETAVFIHDSTRFFITRTYSPALKYYDMIESIGGKSLQGVVLLRRKKEFSYLQGNHTAVQNILNDKYNITNDQFKDE